MMRLTSIVALGITLTSYSAMAQYFDSAEAALAEYVAAYKARDIERFVAAADFRSEAEEALRRAGGLSAEPSEEQIQAKAVLLEHELKEHMFKFGFRAATLDNCQTVTKFQDSESQVRIILSCTDVRGSTTFPVRVARFAQGWRVVRGVGR